MGEHINPRKWGAWVSAIQLFAEHGGWDNDAAISFQDGVIYAGNAQMRASMNEDDLEELTALNWLWDDKYDCWMKFV